MLTSYTIGLLAGALAVSLAAMVLGAFVGAIPLPDPVWSALMLVVGMLLSLRHIGVISFWMPENQRLVPETVFRFGPVIGAAQFGLEMGTGMRTYVTSSLPYLLLLDAVLARDPAACVLAGVGFALGRSLMATLSVSSAEPTGWDQIFKAGRRWQFWASAIFLAMLVYYVAA